MLADDLTDRIWESVEWESDLIEVRKHGRVLIKLIEEELHERKD